MKDRTLSYLIATLLGVLTLAFLFSTLAAERNFEENAGQHREIANYLLELQGGVLEIYVIAGTNRARLDSLQGLPVDEELAAIVDYLTTPNVIEYELEVDPRMVVPRPGDIPTRKKVDR